MVLFKERMGRHDSEQNNRRMDDDAQLARDSSARVIMARVISTLPQSGAKETRVKCVRTQAD